MAAPCYFPRLFFVLYAILTACLATELALSSENESGERKTSYPVGQEFTLKCLVVSNESVDNVRRVWKFKQQIQQSTDRVMTQVASPDNAGEYTCEASFSQNGVETTQHKSLRVNTHKEVVVNHTVVTAKEDASLLCGIHMFGWEETVRFVWLKDLDTIKNNSTDTRIKQNGTFSVLNVAEPYGKEDALGKYVCQMYFQSVYQESAIYIHAKPAIKLVPDSQSVKAEKGESYNLTCQAIGFPRPNISWKKGGVAFNDTVHSADRTLKHTSQVVFKKLSKDDRGEYTCEAANSIGSAQVTIKLRVQDPNAAWWPFAGIVAEVIILAVIIGASEWHNKNQMKKEESKLNHLTSPTTNKKVNPKK